MIGGEEVVPLILAIVGMSVMVWGEWFFLEAKARLLGLMIGAVGVALIAAALAIN